ncbi:glycerophosphodiester phosphodiesterase [Blastopirellula marina]|uniref:Glycerophosphodiester phosphodiesterase n=1 Tax=Blastopirellula marina TaxID=124 RepID=A0A2S8F6K1_9BACT|nr:glycerophosphodiester phosphodiesterase [Blastopirellula marina]PQO27773.1 glycerophosphodiester phosphodiesterase [Blastopirellula marina]PTL41513.1 glycerophosphodiester phosphodiesterase [Blastopirellula marina]
MLCLTPHRLPLALLLLASLFPSSNLLFAAEKGPIIMAHRGGAREFEENTMEGFRNCYERGIRGFETDIRMTKDGVLVVLHDDSLDRTHKGSGAIEEKTAAELKEVVTKKGQKFLFLDELLEYFADKPGVYLELEMKTSNKKLYPDERIAEYCQKLHQAAQKQKPEGSTYVFTSFDERPLKEIHALDPAAPILLIASKPCSQEFIERAKQLGAGRIGCRLEGTSREAVKEAQKNGLIVSCWPGHSVEDYYMALGLGISIHCTDIPMVIQSVKEKLPE